MAIRTNPVERGALDPAWSGFELHRVELQLHHTHAAAHGSVSARPTLLVRAIDADGADGWGECPALPEPGYSPEWTDSAQHWLREHALPAAAATDGSPAAIDRVLARHLRRPMACGAIRSAVLDRACRRANTTLAERLGARRDRLPTGAALSATVPDDPSVRTASIDRLAERAAMLAELGVRRLKLKVQPGWDREPLAACLDAVRSFDTLVAVDANASYDPADGRHRSILRSMAEAGIAWIEQPFPGDALDAAGRIARSLPVPVCLDEPITGPDPVERALATGWTPMICIKPARLGGPREARALVELCRDHGLRNYVGGMLSSGVGRAVDRAVAALAGVTDIGDLGGDDRSFVDDLTTPRITDGADVPVVADRGLGGLGVTVDPARLAALASASWRFGLQR